MGDPLNTDRGYIAGVPISSRSRLAEESKKRARDTSSEVCEEIILKLPSSHKMDPQLIVEFSKFLQAVVNRLYVGDLRYGRPNRRKRFMTRIYKELKTYRQVGNFEQLLNIATYAFLESYAPENKKLFFDPTAASATRDEMGGNIA